MAKIREEQERDQKAMEVIQRVQQKDSPVYESVNNESISRSQIDTSLEEHSSANVAEEVPTTSPTSMDKDMVEEEKTNKKGYRLWRLNQLKKNLIHLLTMAEEL